MSNLNTKLFFDFYSTAHKVPYVDSVVQFISGPFSYAIIPVLFIFYVIIRTERKMYWFSLSFLSFFITWVVTHALKLTVHAQRPFEVLQNVIPLTQPSGYSFPSEHAAVFGALTVVAFHLGKRAGYTMLSVAVVISCSRIVAGVHYPGDVLVGFLLGLSVAQTICYLFKRYL